jgi:cell division protein DivIC
MLQKVKKLVKNKYLIITIVFLVWVLFFDADNVFSHYERRVELRELEARKSFLKQETQKEIDLDKQLINNAEVVERLARELYYMKKSNEVVYVEE